MSHYPTILFSNSLTLTIPLLPLKAILLESSD